MRKFELYLPLKYNDGSEIEPSKIRQIKQELVDQFGAITVSSLSSPYQGRWTYGGVEYIDDIIKIVVVATQDKGTTHFFRQFKQQLKTDLDQVDILITAHGIQVI